MIGPPRNLQDAAQLLLDACEAARDYDDAITTHRHPDVCTAILDRARRLREIALHRAYDEQVEPVSAPPTPAGS